MHNKSMTADNAMSIVGGRNVGDEYFLAKRDLNYSDLDVLVAGPVVDEVSTNFDEYWNSKFAVPARAVVGKPEGFSLDEARDRLDETIGDARETEYASVVRAAAKQNFTRSTLKLAWVPAKMYSDPPSKRPVKTTKKSFLPLNWQSISPMRHQRFRSSLHTSCPASAAQSGCGNLRRGASRCRL
jgi:putative cardiolipin synthase